MSSINLQDELNAHFNKTSVRKATMNLANIRSSRRLSAATRDEVNSDIKINAVSSQKSILNDLEYTSDSRGKLFNITLKKRVAMVANSPKNLAHVRPRNSMPFTPRPINYTPHNPDAQKAFNLQFRSRISPIRRQILVTQSP